ncbi:MAG: hypothetical protein M1133_03150 [Armatimonadetes bacterium]|nr:hypothetical protein [Armatimonadota bacterium]
MRKKRSFWSACESIPGLAAVEAEWRLKSGEQFNAARAFLKPRQAPAASIPCPAKVPCGCYHRIVRHDDGRIAAVCCCEPRSCDVAYVSPGDLIVYELDRQKLHQSIGDALSLRMSEAALPSLRKTTQVGFDSPLAGRDFPVFLTVHYDAEGFHGAVSALSAKNTTPFILISTTYEFCTPDCQAILTASSASFVPLSEIIHLRNGAEPVANPEAKAILDTFHRSILPASVGDGVRLFKTPPNAAWSDLEIKFVYGDKVSVKVLSETGVFNCAEMGMASKKNGEPTKQWELLRDFAKGHRRLDWDSPAADRKNQKRKENLAKDLRAFFGIGGDPFVYLEEIKGWEARFRIEPE